MSIPSILVHLLCLLPAQGAEARPHYPATDPAVLVRFVAPDRQLECLLKLFDGTGASSPAAFLASWRRATNNPEVLGKAPQVLITALNPEMVRELRIFDGATLSIRFDDAGRPRWFLAVPCDDGSLAAAATALALTDGTAQPRVEPLGAEVDRLGKPGAPFMARLNNSVVIAGAYEELSAGFAALRDAPLLDPPDGFDSGVLARIDTATLSRSDQEMLRRLASALTHIGVGRLELALSLTGERLELQSMGSRSNRQAVSDASIDPAWLGIIPRTASVAFAVALDREGTTLNAFFETLDVALHANRRLGAGLPTPPTGAPKVSAHIISGSKTNESLTDNSDSRAIRLRALLNVLANTQGVFPEIELWPRVEGLAGFLTLNQKGSIESLVIVLVARDSSGAEALTRRVVPRLVRPLVEAEKPANATISVEQARSASVTLGSRQGRPLGVALREKLVLVGWGETSPRDALTAREDPAHSAGPSLRPFLESRTSRFAAVWPGRVAWPGIGRQQPIMVALADAPPIAWVGYDAGSTHHDRIVWDGLRCSIARLVAASPRS
jgi:hypothetical protein